MSDEQKKEKKLIIDEDWKEQARREKEILRAGKQQEKAAGPRPPLPKGDFMGLVHMLFTQALMAMGLVRPEGQTEKVPADLEAARYHIDMLEALEQKTGNNLTEQEKRFLTEALHQVRLAFVQASS